MKMLALFPFSLGFLFLLNLTSVAGGDSMKPTIVLDHGAFADGSG